jgi:methyltransferase-like protein 6
MDGGGERESTKHEVDAEYHCHDFDWEDLRADVEANPSLSHHLSSFPKTTASPPPPSSEAWRSFHRRHASGKFFKVTPPSPFVKARSLVPFMRR